jgi:uncharacterized lipoprotein YajG
MRMKPRHAVPLLALALALSACGATQAPMTYAPTVAVQPAAMRAPLVAPVDRVANERSTGREDPTWIGTIRGGYGNPLKALHASEPVDRVVGKAFTDALAARGLVASGVGGAAPYVLTVTIHQFDANQYVRREATADFSVVLTERANGREVWRDREKVYLVDGSALSLSVGVFASVDDLQRVALQAMNQAIDKLVDDPGFRQVLRS